MEGNQDKSGNLTTIPKVSVVIPCYNHGKYLDQCLGSVLNYSPQEDLEIIIVNDGSTDAYTLEKLNQIKQPNLQILHQANQGLPVARNNGIKQSRSNIILNLDSDNFIDPKYIKEALSIFSQNEDVDIVYSDKYIFKDGTQRFKQSKIDKFHINRLLLYNFIDSCAFYRKSIWLKTGGFDPHLSVSEDWEFWLNCFKNKAKFKHIRKPLFYYRVSPNSMLGASNNDKYINAIAFIMNKHLDLYASNLKSLGIATRYMLRKPVFHFIRSLFNKTYQI